MINGNIKSSSAEKETNSWWECVGRSLRMGFPDSNFLSSFDGCSDDMVKSTKFSVHVVNVILFNEATVSAQ